MMTIVLRRKFENIVKKRKEEQKSILIVLYVLED